MNAPAVSLGNKQYELQPDLLLFFPKEQQCRFQHLIRNRLRVSYYFPAFVSQKLPFAIYK